MLLNFISKEAEFVFTLFFTLSLTITQVVGALNRFDEARRVYRALTSFEPVLVILAIWIGLIVHSLRMVRDRWNLDRVFVFSPDGEGSKILAIESNKHNVLFIDAEPYLKVRGLLVCTNLMLSTTYWHGVVFAAELFDTLAIKPSDSVNSMVLHHIADWLTIYLLGIAAVVTLLFDTCPTKMLKGLVKMYSDTDPRFRAIANEISQELVKHPVVVPGISRDTTCYAMVTQGVGGFLLPPVDLQVLRDAGWLSPVSRTEHGWYTPDANGMMEPSGRVLVCGP